MSSKSTTNYQLNQWAAEDPVLRTDFNEDNGKIENALTGLAGSIPKIACGTYTGDGAESRTISLGFRPRAVLVLHESGTGGYFHSDFVCMGGLILDGHPLKTASTFSSAVAGEITNDGFTVKVFRNVSDYLDVRTNEEGAVYFYTALS